MPNITRELIDNFPRPEPHKQAILRDDLLTGFGVRFTSGSISYICETRVDGVPKRVTLCRYPEMMPEEARRKAMKMLGQMAAGATGTSSKRQMPILSEVLDKFFTMRNLRPNSVRHYRSVLQRCIPDWLGLRLDEITKEMVMDRHKELTRPSRQGTDGRAQANKAMEILRVLLNFASVAYEPKSGEPLLQTNPVTTLNRHRSWHKTKQRQRVIPDAKLPLWYREVMALRHTTIRDYLLMVLLTGLRRTECATLRWSENIDFENKVITILADDTKNGREHQLPMSDFIHDLCWEQ